MKKTMTLAAVFGVTALFAAPVEKSDPVAEGYPVWEGVTAKNYIAGRMIFPSDLRHKVTIVVEIEPGEKLVDNLVKASRVMSRATAALTLGHGTNWEDAELPRDYIAAFSVRGVSSPKALEQFMDVIKCKGIADKDTATVIRQMSGQVCAFYQDLTFAGAPDTAGKRPYVYVFGPTGAEPICQGPLEATLKDAQSAIAKAKKEIDGWETKWKPFFGNIDEPKFNTSLAKTLEKGKTAKKAPLMAVEKALLNDIKSKDAEKAKEAQILYDAVVQTRSDLIMRIRMEAAQCPHRAYYDVNTLLKYWPTMTKQLEAVSAKMKTNPQCAMMGNIFTKLIVWGDPAFSCKPSEAKKIVAELNKMKKTLAPLKESKDIPVQDGALLLDMRLDTLIPIMQAKAEAK